MNQPSLNCEEGEKILFIDDDEALAKIMGDILRMLECDAEIYTNPLEAFDVFEKDPASFDLVITDLGFDGFNIDGKELIEKIFGIRKKIEIILLTGRGEGSVVIKNVKVLNKPIKLEELRIAIRESLDAAKAVKAS